MRSQEDITAGLHNVADYCTSQDRGASGSQAAAFHGKPSILKRQALCCDALTDAAQGKGESVF